jgi:RimJ/RimL family protein N-acetyltransferase
MTPAGRFPELTREDVFRIETKRLWLRWPQARDVAAIERFAALAAVAEMTATWQHPLPAGEVERRVLKAREANADGRSLTVAITRRALPTRAIGLAGLSPSLEGAVLSLGYLLAPDHHGLGLMTEAVGGLVDFAFRYTDIEALTAVVMVENVASLRVLEKAGFETEGRHTADLPARGPGITVERFRLTRADWRRRTESRPSVPRVRDTTGAAMGAPV